MGTNPYIGKMINNYKNINPYFNRGFKRGMDEKSLVNKFFFCLGLVDAPYFIALFDTILSMIYFVLIFVNIDTILWPFYLMYLIFSASKISVFL
jgi:hypothetical protein